MNLYLIGHDYRYAAEQMLLTLFPDERPVYPDGRPTGDRAELRLMSGAKVTTATCVLVYQAEKCGSQMLDGMKLCCIHDRFFVWGSHTDIKGSDHAVTCFILAGDINTGL